MIRVLVSGSGKMGRTIIDGLEAESDMEPVAVVDALTSESSLTTAKGRELPLYADAVQAIAETSPDVCVDFTNAAWTPTVTDACLAHGVRLVIGTTGLSDEYIERLRRTCAERKIGGVLAANFTIGAVLMMHLARIAAPYFEAAEIIELHHDQKADAPSGTSIATARGMLDARDGRAFGRNVPEATPIEHTRGNEIGGVTMHSIRLPGFIAHQEVLFGGLGQTLSIRHDTTGRDCYLPGIVLAIRNVMERDDLVVGLDKLMGLSPQGPATSGP
jgi:4-hydroxy-tetrahydrodipicolinate reductase